MHCPSLHPYGQGFGLEGQAWGFLEEAWPVLRVLEEALFGAVLFAEALLASGAEVAAFLRVFFFGVFVAVETIITFFFTTFLAGFFLATFFFTAFLATFFFTAFFATFLHLFGSLLYLLGSFFSSFLSDLYTAPH